MWSNIDFGEPNPSSNELKQNHRFSKPKKSLVLRSIILTKSSGKLVITICHPSVNKHQNMTYLQCVSEILIFTTLECLLSSIN
jgi:hypothetical protein